MNRHKDDLVRRSDEYFAEHGHAPRSPADVDRCEAWNIDARMAEAAGEQRLVAAQVTEPVKTLETTVRVTPRMASCWLEHIVRTGIVEYEDTQTIDDLIKVVQSGRNK